MEGGRCSRSKAACAPRCSQSVPPTREIPRSSRRLPSLTDFGNPQRSSVSSQLHRNLARTCTGPNSAPLGWHERRPVVARVLADVEIATLHDYLQPSVRRVLPQAQELSPWRPELSGSAQGPGRSACILHCSGLRKPRPLSSQSCPTVKSRCEFLSFQPVVDLS